MPAELDGWRWPRAPAELDAGARGAPAELDATVAASAPALQMSPSTWG